MTLFKHAGLEISGFYFFVNSSQKRVFDCSQLQHTVAILEVRRVCLAGGNFPQLLAGWSVQLDCAIIGEVAGRISFFQAYISIAPTMDMAAVEVLSRLIICS